MGVLKVCYRVSYGGVPRACSVGQEISDQLQRPNPLMGRARGMLHRRRAGKEPTFSAMPSVEANHQCTGAPDRQG